MNALRTALTGHLPSRTRRLWAKRIFPLLAALFCGTAAVANDRETFAEDDASNAAYKEGWRAGPGGSGFSEWTLQALKAEGVESHAGFFIADLEHNPDARGIAIRRHAFGLYANGVSFEVAAAFRTFKKPLAIGQTFSFLVEHGPFEKKFEGGDPSGGSIGITLRAGDSAGTANDYNKGARFEFGAYQGKSHYQIYDGSPDHDTGIALTDGGLSVSLTLLSPDTYDLEVTTLADKKTTTLKGRKLGGGVGAKIESLCVFNRNAEKHDAFFNGFQVTGDSE